MTDTRRGFLAKLGMMATAPVLTAFVDDEGSGLAVPDRRIEVAKETPPPMVISSLVPPGPGFHQGDMMRAPDGQIVLLVNGGAWRVPAWRV